MKLYFERHSDFCYPLKDIKAHIKDAELKTLTVYPAIKTKVKGMIYCRHFQLVGENHCGKQCEAYAPRNGKSGCCKHLGSLYEPDFNKPKIIK
jgi:hypothetical protein